MTPQGVHVKHSDKTWIDGTRITAHSGRMIELVSPDTEQVIGLSSLPEPIQTAVKALPAFAEAQRKPFVSELHAIDPLTGQTKWAAPMQGWQAIRTSPAIRPLTSAVTRGGPVQMPPELPALQVAPAQEPGVTAATIKRGRALFFSNCVLSHSNQHRSITPDLRRMQPGTHVAFRNIVLGGILVANGMPRSDDQLKPQDADAIHAYLMDLQARTRTQELENQKAGLPLDTPSPAILSSY